MIWGTNGKILKKYINIFISKFNKICLPHRSHAMIHTHTQIVCVQADSSGKRETETLKNSKFYF